MSSIPLWSLTIISERNYIFAKSLFHSCMPLVRSGSIPFSFNKAFTSIMLPGLSLKAIMIKASRGILAYNSGIPYFLSARCVSLRVNSDA